MNKNIKTAGYILITVFLTLGLSISLQSLLADWVPPTNTAPADNINPPINSGHLGQAKQGNLILNTDNNPTGLVVNGNVGLGISTPNANFQIDANAGSDATFKMSNDLSGAGGTDGFQIKSRVDDLGVEIWNYENSYMRFGTDNSERMFINHIGNIGVGTANPQAKLHVYDGQSSISVNNEVAVFSNAGSDAGYSYLVGPILVATTDGNGTLRAGDENNALVRFGIGGGNTGSVITEYFRINGNGNVGIGTNSPNGKLHISSPGANYIFTSNSTSGYTTTFNMNNTGLYIGHNSASRSLILTTNGANRLAIGGGGGVAIGKLIPNSALDVNGTIRAYNVCDENGSNCIDMSSGQWKLAAKSHDSTEEARINLYPDQPGFSIETDSSFDYQYVDGRIFDFPTTATEILFFVESNWDNFCAGGNGTLNLADAGAGTYPNGCLERFYKGTSRYFTVRATPENWIALSINGARKSDCISNNFPVMSNPEFTTYPGRWVQGVGGTNFAGVVCRYTRSSTSGRNTWSGDISSLRIEEADWSPNYGDFAWEIWYR